jgi:hypothetical protein
MTDEQAQQMLDAIEAQKEALDKILVAIQELPEVTAFAIARELGVDNG